MNQMLINVISFTGIEFCKDFINIHKITNITKCKALLNFSLLTGNILFKLHNIFRKYDKILWNCYSKMPKKCDGGGKSFITLCMTRKCKII